MKNIFMIFIVLIFNSEFIFSHEKHLHKTKPQELKLEEVSEDKKEIELEKPYKLKPKELLFEHVHNKLVHFPFGFAFLGLVFTLLVFKQKEFLNSVKITVLLAGLSTIAVAISGFFQREQFINDPKEWVLKIHAALGVLTTISFWSWFLFLNIEKLKRFAWILPIVTFILILTTGFYGGILSHG